MQIMGFIDNSAIQSILSVSDSFMLFYLENDKTDDIRAVNHTKFGEFFEMDTGNPIFLVGLLNYELINSSGEIIFQSEKLITDEELVIQYGILKTKFESDSEIN